MGVCVDKLPHECGTTKGLQVFADSETGVVDGFCFSCSTYVTNPYGEPKTIDDVELPKEKTPEEIEEELKEILTYPSPSLVSRMIRGKYLEQSHTKVALSEQDGKTPVAVYFPITKNLETTGYYIKTLGKPSHQSAIGDVTDGQPFGWREASQSGAHSLIITEGREDKLALEQILDKHSTANYSYAVISLPNGTNSAERSLGPLASEIDRKFQEVLICYDNDPSGEKAEEKTMLIFPKAKTITLPAKDANDCILQRVTKEAFNAIAYRAKAPKNTRLVLLSDIAEEAREPTPWGELSWPFPHLDKLMRGIRYGETIYIGSGVKMGKSELLNHLAAHFVINHDAPVFLAKPEESNKKTVKHIAGKVAARKFNDPEVDFDFEAYDEAVKKLGDKVVMLDLYQHLGWDTLKQDIVYAATNMGVKAVFIDPITNLTNGQEAGDANTALSGIAQDLAALALDLNIVVFIFCHLKAPDGNLSRDVRAKKYASDQFVGLGNCPHEYGGDVLSNQFAGSRAMMRSCNLMIGLEGNKDSELPKEVRQLRWLSILEDREFGNSEKVGIHWNENTTLYTEI